VILSTKHINVHDQQDGGCGNLNAYDGVLCYLLDKIHVPASRKWLFILC